MAEHEESRLADRRAAILAAAEKVFGARGYAAATIDAVAAEAGMSKGNIYNYFRSKEDLFKAVFANAIASAESDVGHLAAGAAPASQRLEELLDYWFARLGYFRRIGRLVLEVWATAAREDQQGELSATLRQVQSEWRARIAAILAQGVEAGEFNLKYDSHVAASLIQGLLDGIEIESILGIGVEVDEDLMTALKRAIMIGLRAGVDRGAETRQEGEA